MATAFFGTRGVTVARNLLKASSGGLDKIYGGGIIGGDPNRDEFTLVWENYGFGLKTTNRMATNNALIFQYPAEGSIIDIVLLDSLTGEKGLTLNLQKGTLQNDTIKFIREIVITLDVVQSG